MKNNLLKDISAWMIALALFVCVLIVLITPIIGNPKYDGLTSYEDQHIGNENSTVHYVKPGDPYKPTGRLWR